MRYLRILGLALLTACLVSPGEAQAALITPGFTFSVATSGSSTGTHFHSSTGGDFGNPAGLAEVGELFTEGIRGLSEYDLNGLSAAASAFVSFDVHSLAGLFGQSGYFGPIDVFAYAGNNLEDISDYHIATIGNVGSFNSTGLAVGETVSLEITSIFNQALLDTLPSLGIRLQPAGGTNDTAITFNNFRLTTDDQTTAAPEPGLLLLLGTGVLTIGSRLRNRRD